MAQMYVWIPRYEYETITSETPVGIKTKFIPKTKTTPTSNYVIHPSFIFGTQQLTGLWVGKFETSHVTLSSSTTSNNLGCTTETCTNADGLRILPNKVSLRYNNTSNFFYASRSISRSGNPFGIDKTKIDTHMMKNTEWGAVAYLSHSKYGIKSEIRINNNSKFQTGCGASSENGQSTSLCEIQYGNSTTYPQSTTGNITGVFDMSGGAWEWVMGVQCEFSSTTLITVRDSGFTTSSLQGTNSKYVDKYLYSTSSADYNRAILGDATKETKGWYEDTMKFVDTTGGQWFYRGNVYGNRASAGIFGFQGGTGKYFETVSFRVVLAIP